MRLRTFSLLLIIMTYNFAYAYEDVWFCSESAAQSAGQQAYDSIEKTGNPAWWSLPNWGGTCAGHYVVGYNGQQKSNRFYYPKDCVIADDFSCGIDCNAHGWVRSGFAECNFITRTGGDSEPYEDVWYCSESEAQQAAEETFENSFRLGTLDWWSLSNWGGSCSTYYVIGYNGQQKSNKYFYPNDCALIDDYTCGSTNCLSQEPFYNIDKLGQCLPCNLRDTDSDGIVDCEDNCLEISNPEQENSDSDSHGNTCDNCLTVDNEDQADSDGDGDGDVCDNCEITISVDKQTLSPGDTAIVIATIDPDPPTDGQITWSIVPDMLSTAKATINPDADDYGKTARITDVSGEGNLIITATHPDGCTSNEAIIFVGCAMCSSGGNCNGPGDGSFGLSSIKGHFNLGKTTGGKSAGQIVLQAETPDPLNATPQILKGYAFGNETNFLYDGNILKQALAPETFVNIVVIDDYSYNIYFYTPDAVVDTLNGLYVVDASATPIVTWTVENPDASPTIYNRIKITESKQGATNTFDYQLDEMENTWSLSKGNGLQITTRKTETISGDRVVTEIIKDDMENVASKIKTTWRPYPWGDSIIEKVVDPDGAALTTSTTYYEDISDPGSYGRIETQTYPDGSWKRYEYDYYGRKTIERSSWLNGVPSSLDRIIQYDYTPIDAEDTQSAFNMRQPRTVTEVVEGNIVKLTYYAYKTNASIERIEVEEQCVSPGAAYEDTENLHTERTYYELATGLIEAGRIKSIQYPDNRFDSYTYEYGAYTVAGDPSQPSTFTPGTGLDVRETVTHGTATNPSGISNKTTREITIKDEFGNPVLQETYIYTGMGYDRIKWTIKQYTDAGQMTEINTSDGTHSEANWGCCYKESETDIYGITKSYTMDDLHRINTKEKQTINGSVFTSYTYDAVGRKLSQTVNSGGLSLGSSSEYDIGGRLLNTTDTTGLVTDYDYELDGRRTTITRPGDATEITEKYLDGRIKSITGTGVVPRYFTYGVNPDGTQWTQVNIGSELSVMWEKATVDMLGRTIKIEKPGFTGIETTQYVYNNDGRLEKTISPGQAATLYVYDYLGNQFQSGLDIDGNGSLDRDSSDRISESDTMFHYFDGDWWQQRFQLVYATDSEETTNTINITQTRLTGLGTDGLVSETISTDIHGNETVSQVTIDQDAQVQTRTIDYPDSNIDAVSITTGGLLTSSQTKTGVTITYDYDALERRTEVTDPRTGTTITSYNEFNQIDYIEDPAQNRVTFTYDPDTGQKIAETKPLNTITRYAYNDHGQVSHIWGGATYPVKYLYDDLGHMIEMHTFQNGSGWEDTEWPMMSTGTSDVTTWHYQESTGLLTEKEDALGNQVSYVYTTGGKLDTRTWARLKNATPLVTTYIYDPDTGELTDIDYSDDTPDIDFTYDRLGRQDTITDALGTRTFTYNNMNLQLATESIAGLYSKVITRTYATSGVWGRTTGLNTGSDYSITYDYDDTGRFDTVIWNVDSASQTTTYTYIPDSDLIDQVTTTSGQQISYIYEPNRNLRTQVKNQFGTTLISQYDYTHDELGQRKISTNSGKALIEALNTKLTGAAWFENAQNTGDGIEIPTETRTYGYDHIGNRNQSTDWDSIAEDYISTNYTPNALNQYDQKTNGSNTTSYTYDDDGNLDTLTNGSSTNLYTYNAENRLTSVEPETPVAGDKKIEYTYDYMGRRVQKVVSTWNGSDWDETTEKLFVYDGWNLIQEETIETGSTIKYYVWGLDLSQSLQGAGGVGGLLAVVDGGVTYHVNYDGNGNVTQFVNAADGTIAAHYEYDPYGNLNYSSGSYKDENPFRFSTKYHDDETGLVYYGYRYYDPEIGMWLNRDPLGEEGSLNLYLFVLNGPLNYIDPFGDDWRTVLQGSVQVISGALLWVAAGGSEVFTAGGATPGAIFLASWGTMSIINGINTIWEGVHDNGPPDAIQVRAVEDTWEYISGSDLSPRGKFVVRGLYYTVDVATACYSVSLTVKAVKKTMLFKHNYVVDTYETSQMIKLEKIVSKIQLKALPVSTIIGQLSQIAFDFYSASQTIFSFPEEEQTNPVFPQP